MPYSFGMTVDDFSGIAKFMRATNPTWSNAQVAEYMRREGPPRHDGGPVTDGYVGRMLVREKVINRMNARLRKKRLLAARQRGRHTRAEWLDMIAVFKGRCVGCGRKDRPVTKDHIIPLCEDGSSDGIENLQPLCLPCNASGKYMDRRDKARTVWTPVKIQALRANLGETVEAFAERFGRSGRTVEDWEQGRRRPDVMVLLAMQKLSRRFERGTR